MARGIAVDRLAGPCWAWRAYRLTANSEMPDLRSSGHLSRGTHGARIRLSVPQSELLLSQFLMWEYVLLGEYVVLSRDELRRIEDGKPDRAQIETSWHRIFDLEAGDPELWKPLGRRPIQACLGRIELSWVRKVETFVAR